MKTFLGFAISVLFAADVLVAAGGEKDAAVEREKALWQLVQEKKWDAFRKYFAADYHAVYREGIFNLDQEIAAVQKTDLKSFSFSDVSIGLLGNDALVLTYKVAAQGTQDGKDMSGVYYCASVWHKSGNDWKAVFHTEVVPQP